MLSSYPKASVRPGIAELKPWPRSYSPTTVGRIRAGSAPPFHSPLWSRRFLYGTHRGGVKNSVSHFVFGVGVRSCLLIHDSRLDPGETPVADRRRRWSPRPRTSPPTPSRPYHRILTEDLDGHPWAGDSLGTWPFLRDSACVEEMTDCPKGRRSAPKGGSWWGTAPWWGDSVRGHRPRIMRKPYRRP